MLILVKSINLIVYELYPTVLLPSLFVMFDCDRSLFTITDNNNSNLKVIETKNFFNANITNFA